MNYILKNGEQEMLLLRELYESHGYSHFKMSKFEEYDLYAKNKDFLKGGNILTFTDLSGRLMALKPDVTMSIIKNSSDESDNLDKVYYNENVYRAESGSFKEIMQTGLECIGKIDLFSICEVISLAAKSLERFSDDYVLDISHMGILAQMLKNINTDSEIKQEIVGCIERKSLHELKEICKDVDAKAADKLAALIELDPDTEKGLKELKKLCPDSSAVSELEKIIDVLNVSVGANRLRLDFSVVQDLSYYNGIVFQGFIDGIPEKLLSGGQYDKLVKRMGKNSGAIGFGISTELLSRLQKKAKSSADILIIYDEDDDVKALMSEVSKLIKSGKRVEVQRQMDGKKKYGAVMKFEKGGLADV